MSGVGRLCQYPGSVPKLHMCITHASFTGLSSCMDAQDKLLREVISMKHMEGHAHFKVHIIRECTAAANECEQQRRFEMIKHLINVQINDLDACCCSTAWI